MSIQFNSTSTPYKGLVQIFEREIGANLGDISGNAQKLAEFTTDANLALDDFFYIAFKAGGTWQFDDSNHGDFPVITTNLVAGQRDYSFSTDGSSNIVLEIAKVARLGSSTATLYEEITPVDPQSDQTQYNLISNDTTQGIPDSYDKLGNGILLSPIPSYSATNGLRVYISREGSYFATSDTTKKPGVPGLFHKYFALKPALDYARRNSLASYNRLEKEIADFEKHIETYFGNREKDVRHVMNAFSTKRNFR